MENNYLVKAQELQEVRLTGLATLKSQQNITRMIETGQEANLQYAINALKILVPVFYSELKEWTAQPKAMARQDFLRTVLCAKQSEWGESDKKSSEPFMVVAETVSVLVMNRISQEQSFIGLSRLIHKGICFNLNLEYDNRAELDKSFIAFISNLLGRVKEKQNIFLIEKTDTTDYRIKPTEAELDNILQAQKLMFKDVDDYKPMICPPRHHTSLLSEEGGYLIQPSPLLKHPTKLKGKVHDAIKQFNDKRFLDAVNRIQDTPYEVNHKLLAVLTELYATGRCFHDYANTIERCEDKYVQEAAKEIKRKNANRKRWAVKKNVEFVPVSEKHQATIYSKASLRAKSEVQRTNEVFRQAQTYDNRSSFYFPMFADLRGRLYCYSTYGLSIQGNEMSKALVHFANKEAITKEGLAALFQTLGNALGHDKKDIRTKEVIARDWFKANCKAIESEDYDVFFDTEMDEPITALAISLELIEIKKDYKYKTGIICHRDARCSGASIVGTMMDCKKTMALTSLVEEDQLSGKLPDGYMATAEAALKMAMDSDSQIAKDLYQNKEVMTALFSRSAFKKAVMTKTSYGLTDYSIRVENEELFLDSGLFDTEEDGGYGLGDEHKALYDKIKLEALAKSMPACYSFLNQMKEVASTVNEEQQSILTYNNPMSGFPITRLYEETKKTKINVQNGFQKIQVVYHEKTGKANKRKSVSAFSPNFVHSCDAGLLIEVRNDVDYDLALIHDSIGSHPNNVNATLTSYKKAIAKVHNPEFLQGMIDSMGIDYKIKRIGDNVSDESIMNSEHALA